MREQNETTLSKVLLNEKDCQNCPKMVIEYQPALMEESAEDQVLEKQETKTGSNPIAAPKSCEVLSFNQRIADLQKV